MSTHTFVPRAMRLGWAATLLQAIVAPLSVSSFKNDMSPLQNSSCPTLLRNYPIAYDIIVGRSMFCFHARRRQETRRRCYRFSVSHVQHRASCLLSCCCEKVSVAESVSQAVVLWKVRPTIDIDKVTSRINSSTLELCSNDRTSRFGEQEKVCLQEQKINRRSTRKPTGGGQRRKALSRRAFLALVCERYHTMVTITLRRVTR